MKKRVFRGYANSLKDVLWWAYRGILFSDLSKRKYEKNEKKFKITIEEIKEALSKAVARVMAGILKREPTQEELLGISSISPDKRKKSSV